MTGMGHRWLLTGMGHRCTVVDERKTLKESKMGMMKIYIYIYEMLETPITLFQSQTAHYGLN